MNHDKDSKMTNRTPTTEATMVLLHGVLIAIITWLLLSADTLFAYPLDLVVVRRDDITTSQQIEMFQQATARLREVNISIQLKSIREVEDTVQKNKLEQNWSRLFDWAKAVKRDPNRITYFLLPPLDNVYLAGAFGAQCVTTRNKSRRYGYSVMKLKNTTGEDRTQASMDIVLHELLHGFGAGHIDTRQNIMRSYYVPGPKRILRQTLREINYCKNGKSSKGN
jgi:hypothetical protein